MKKIVLYGIVIFSLVSSIDLLAMDNNSNNINRECVLDKDVWSMIASKLVKVENIESAKTLDELKSEVEILFKRFALISKMHKAIVQLIKEEYL